MLLSDEANAPTGNIMHLFSSNRFPFKSNVRWQKQHLLHSPPNFLILMVADETTDVLFSLSKFEGKKPNTFSPESFFLWFTIAKVWESAQRNIRYYGISRHIAKCFNFKQRGDKVLNVCESKQPWYLTMSSVSAKSKNAT